MEDINFPLNYEDLDKDDDDEEKDSSDKKPAKKRSLEPVSLSALFEKKREEETKDKQKPEKKAEKAVEKPDRPLVEQSPTESTTEAVVEPVETSEADSQTPEVPKDPEQEQGVLHIEQDELPLPSPEQIEEPLDKLDDYEEKHVVRDFVTRRENQLEEELKTKKAEAAESADVAELEAALKFLQRTQQKNEVAETFDEEILDESLAEAAAVEDIELSAESPSEELAEEDDQPNATSSGGSPTTTSTLAAAATLPTPTQNPTPSFPASPSFGGGPGGPTGPQSPNLAPNPNLNIQPNASPEAAQFDRRPNAAGYFLLGGIVGYLVGRRRGRVKTEAELKPIQAKLEKEVTALYYKIAEREQKIRDLAREAYERKRPLAAAEQPVAAEILRQQRPESSNVEQMEIYELVQIAKGAKYEKTNLKKLYESGQIELPVLRRAIAEFLAGREFIHIIESKIKSPEKNADKTPEMTAGQPPATPPPFTTNYPSMVSPQAAVSEAQNSSGTSSSTDALGAHNPNYRSHNTPKPALKGATVAIIGILFMLSLAIIFLWLNHKI